MKAIQTQTLELPTRKAVHTVVIVLIMVGVGGAMAFGALGGIQDNLGGLTGSNHIAITKVTAYTDGDRLVISGDMKNLGSQAVTSVLIDEISVGSLLITQNPAVDDGQIAAGHGALTLEGLQHDGTDFGPITRDLDEAVAAITASATSLGWAVVAVAGTPATDTATVPNVEQYRLNPTATVGGATVDLTGLSSDENALSSLPAGSSQLFRIVVTGISSGTNPNVLDVLRTVPAGSEVFVTLIGTDGQSSTASEPRTATVKQR